MYNVNRLKCQQVYHLILKDITKNLNEAFVAKKDICYSKSFDCSYVFSCCLCSKLMCFQYPKDLEGKENTTSNLYLKGSKSYDYSHCRQDLDYKDTTMIISVSSCLKEVSSTKWSKGPPSPLALITKSKKFWKPIFFHRFVLTSLAMNLDFSCHESNKIFITVVVNSHNLLQEH